MRIVCFSKYFVEKLQLFISDEWRELNQRRLKGLIFCKNHQLSCLSNSVLYGNIEYLECTIGVENLDEIVERVKNNGGQLLLPKTAIPFVGWIAKFLDTEGNLICAMQYDNSAR